MNTLTRDAAFRRTMKTPGKRSPGIDLLDAWGRRLLDITAAFWGLFFLSPFFLIIAMMIKKDSPGPVFYWGKRVGKGGREFGILKFRTMYEDPKSYQGPKVTGQGDQRITLIGEWLRRTKINELPQLWNVLKGDMSLVGPRPEDPDFVKQWPDEVRKELLNVRPGVTSPASVIYRDEESMLPADSVMDDYLRSILPTKLRLDQLYVRNRSLFTDLDVIFWTIIILIPQARKEKIPETKLYWGPLSVFMAHDLRWFVLDLLVVLLSIASVGIIWRTITPLHIGWQVAPLVAFVMAFVFSLANAVRGLNRVYWIKAAPGEALDLLLTSVISTLILWVSDFFFFTRVHVPVGLFVVGGVFAYLGFVGVRYRERILTGLATRWLSLRRGGAVIGERLLVVGAGELGQFASWLVRKGHLAQAFNLVGLVDDDPRKQGLRVDGVKVIGTTTDLKTLIEQHDVGLVLFAISNIDLKEKFRILTMCYKLPVRLVLIPNVVEMMRDEFRTEDQHSQRSPVSSLLAPARINLWLNEMEALLQAGDYEAVHMHIDHLRGEIRLGHP